MPKVNLNLPQQNFVSQAFDREANRYDQFAALEREVGSRLLERLDFQRRVPTRIIDLGSGTGHCTATLKRRFRKSEVVALDASLAMSQQSKRRSNFLHPLRVVCADLASLPFADQSTDLLFSNLALQWCQDFRLLTAGFRRILRPDGLLLFSTLGPDSMKEFRSAAAYDQNSVMARQFVDMHDIGDALLAAGFSEPVMDSECITTEYQQFETLLSELEATGASTHFSDWTRQTERAGTLLDSYGALRRNGRYPVTWEIVYGAAFGPGEGQPIKTGEGDVAAFSVDYLKASRPRR